MRYQKVAILLSLFGFFVRTTSKFCSFPAALVQKQVWYLQVQNQGLRTGLILEFLDQHSMLWYNHSGMFPTENEWNCLHNDQQGSIVLKSMDSFTSKITNLCVNFMRKAEYVYYVYFGDYATNGSCVGMKLFPWLMVQLDFRDKYQNCLLTGGFNFDITTVNNNQTLCRDFWLKPFMESDCMTGDGITVDFRLQGCKGELRMTTKQNLQCLGAWNDGHLYIVLTDDRTQDIFKPVWLLILNSQDTATMTGNLLFDLKVGNFTREDVGQGYQLTFNRTFFPSVCENEAVSCSQCSGIQSYYCRKACGICSEQDEPDNCIFDSSLKGRWLQYTNESVDSIMISTTEMFHYEWGHMTCKELNDTEPLSFLYVLQSSNTNGCKPRFTCANIRKITDSVIEYRLGQSTVFTYQSDLSFQRICDEDTFRDDFAPLGDKYRSYGIKYLISSEHRIQTLCWLPERSVELVFDSSGCVGTLSVCKTSQIHTTDRMLELKSLSKNCSFTVKYYRCLASKSIDAYRVIVVDEMSDGDVGEGWCFILQLHIQVGNRVMLMPAAQCDTTYMLEARTNLLPTFVQKLHVPNVTNEQNQCENLVDWKNVERMTSKMTSKLTPRMTSNMNINDVLFTTDSPNIKDGEILHTSQFKYRPTTRTSMHDITKPESRADETITDSDTEATFSVQGTGLSRLSISTINEVDIYDKLVTVTTESDQALKSAQEIDPLVVNGAMSLMSRKYIIAMLLLLFVYI